MSIIFKTVRGTLRQVSEAPSTPIPHPILPSPLYTQYTCIQYTYSHREGGKGEANQREGQGGRSQFHKAGRKHRGHILVELKQGQCICPLSWSVHCNFTGEGSERGWACTPPPPPYQPRSILPSWWNVRQKSAVTTLCTLWSKIPEWLTVSLLNTVKDDI
jgi:hypothetical protein